MGARGPMAYPVSSHKEPQRKMGRLGEDIKDQIDIWKKAEIALQTIAEEEDRRLVQGQTVPEGFDEATQSAIRLQTQAIDALLEKRSKSLMDIIAKLNIWFANDLGSATDISSMTLSERLACQALRELNDMAGFSETLDERQTENLQSTDQ